MNYYIGEPRGDRFHPNSPDYDSSRDDAIDDEAKSGTLALNRSPGYLLYTLGCFCEMDDEHAEAIRQLLAPLYDYKNHSPQMRKLWEDFTSSDGATNCAADVLDELAEENSLD